MPDLFAEPLLVSGPQECRFYHTLDLPVSGVQQGQWDLRGRFEEYTLDVALSGKSLLDVGTASGFLSFEAEKRGATVVSVEADSPARWDRLPFVNKLAYKDRQAWNRDPVIQRNLEGLKRSYWLAHREFGSRARAYYGDAGDLPEALGRFDVVIVGQILVHLQDVIRPLTSICRRCNDTLVITEGMLVSSEPTSQFLGSASNPDRDHSFWFHSVGVYRELLGMLGFSLEAQGTRPFTCNVEGHLKDMPLTTLVFRRVPGSGP